MAIQIDDTFLDDLGLKGASDVQKQAFMQQILETLELRVGTRLAEELSDEQIREFETISPLESDLPEVISQKQEQMINWLKVNHPNYDTVIAQELAKLKGELASSLDTILGNNAG